MKRSGYTIDADLSECRICGALVSDEVRHTEFHRQLAQILVLLKYPGVVDAR